MATATKPRRETYPEYYWSYVEGVPENDLRVALESSHRTARELLQSISEERGGFRYAPGKWSIKELVQHIIDCERVFSYRATSLARGEKQPLLPFDEDEFAAASDADRRSMAELAAEFDCVRRSSIALYDGMSEEMLERSGIANDQPVNVAMLGFLTSGHLLHHLRVLEERYLEG